MKGLLLRSAIIYRRFMLSVMLISLLVTLSRGAVIRADVSDSIFSIAWSPDGSKIAAAASNGEVRIVEVHTGKLLNTISQPGSVGPVQWSRDGSKLASGGSDAMVYVWNATDGKLIYTLKGHTESIGTIAWSADGRRVVSVDTQEIQELRVWNADTGELLEKRNAGTTVQVVWSPDNTLVAQGEAIGIVVIEDGQTLAPLYELDAPESNTKNYKIYDPLYNIWPLAWSPDGTRIATGSLNGVVRIWDVTNRRIVATLHGNESKAYDRDKSVILGLTFNADGSKLFSISADGTLRAWNTATQQVIQTIQLKPSAPMYAIAWSAYGAQLAYGGSPAPSDTIQTQQLGSSATNIIVPFPSANDLQALVNRCILDSSTKQTLLAKATTTQLPDFIAQITGLSEQQIPAACKSDLVAVASVLHGQ